MTRVHIHNVSEALEVVAALMATPQVAVVVVVIQEVELVVTQTQVSVAAAVRSILARIKSTKAGSTKATEV